MDPKQTTELEATLQHAPITRRAFNAGLAGAATYPWLPAWANAQQPPTLATTAIPVPSRSIAYLMADEANRPSSLETRTDETNGMVKRFWVQNWRDPQQSFEWTLDVKQAGRYGVTLMISAPPGSKVQVEGPTDKLICETTQPRYGGYWWDRITLPTPLTLVAGKSSVRIRLLQPVTIGRFGAALKSIELLDMAERPAMDARIKAFKSDTTWLNDAKFGFMCQCGEWAYPPHGPRKPWPAFADGFDANKFAEMVDSTGAGYAIWSATWATYYFPAPIKAIDAIMPGRTSERDLIGDIADALAKRNIKLILYYHLGHDTNPANGSWWSKNWVSPSDKTLFEKNWLSIITEVGERYKDRLAGWMFDDDLVYYPVPYEQFGAAAKAGSRARIIAYNPWIQARGTDFQDFQFGEGFTGSPDLPISAQGIWPSGPQKGLHAHGNFQIDGPDWGINKPNTVIEPPHLMEDKAIQIALDAAQRDIALSWNLLMYDDGSVSNASLALLQKVGKTVRNRYPRAKS
jgi:hypothetical protein